MVRLFVPSSSLSDYMGWKLSDVKVLLWLFGLATYFLMPLGKRLLTVIYVLDENAWLPLQFLTNQVSSFLFI
ncbi:hypothetical protein RJT34_16423 [Clitoria ternatea]|uniref:Uncharacterized protein n=1 Tax=Clitoria ternatea TaxID=43366 RepID=A0AAN9PC90_CLITE